MKLTSDVEPSVAWAVAKGHHLGGLGEERRSAGCGFTQHWQAISWPLRGKSGSHAPIVVLLYGVRAT